MDKKMNYLSGVLDTAGVCMKFTATSYKKHVSGEVWTIRKQGLHLKISTLFDEMRTVELEMRSTLMSIVFGTCRETLRYCKAFK